MHSRFYILTLLLSATLLIGACTSTEVHTFRSTELIGKYYDRILFIIDIPNVTDRAIAEEAFRNAFTNYGLQLFTAHELFSEFNNLKEEELLALLENSKIHSVLTVTPITAVDLMATVEQDERFKSKKLSWANKLIFYANPDPVIPVTELLYTGVDGQFSLRLYDLESEKIAWLGVSISERTGLSSFEQLICDNARETVKTLSAQKLIAPAVSGE